MEKRILASDRLRRVPGQFSWIDQRLLWDRHFKRCSVAAWGLYLFLLVVGDSQGLSYYSDARVGDWLSVSEEELKRLRHELLTAGVIAYQAPLYQVLSLGTVAPSARPKLSQPAAVRDVLRKMIQGAEQAMIDYDTFCRIKQLAAKELLSTAQIAAELGLDWRTVAYWLRRERFQQRETTPRASLLDPYKDNIQRLLEKHDYSAAQILLAIREQGYQGKYTIVKDYVRKVRPPRRAAYLTLSFAPGECAQVDWGSLGTVGCGQTRRKLSFFVMVLCYSRLMYVEFTVRQTMEHFLGCHQNAFEFFGLVPHSIMLDNLRSAVLQHHVGEAPVFNPHYLDFARHYGFEIRACTVGKGNEKGRVENGVGYVKKNFLRGLDIPDFSALGAAAARWRDEVANVRIHGVTKKRPCDLFIVEKPSLRPLPDKPYDIGTVISVRASSTFRVTLDTNHYSVPAEYAGAQLTLKAYPDRLCLYSGENLIARHPRSYDRHQDFEHPDHPKALLAERHRARQQKIYARFLALSPKADEYYRLLAERRLNPRQHVQKIVALSEIYGDESVARAIEASFAIQAFSSEYIANICEQRARPPAEPGALHLTRKSDLLELDIPAPDLSIYDSPGEII